MSPTEHPQNAEPFSLSPKGGPTYEIKTVEITEHDPKLIKTIIDIDLMTYSAATFSHHTAGLILRYGRGFLLTANDSVIGTCQCIRSWERASEAILFSMAIRPGWRGRGLGTRFMQGVLEALRENGVRSVVLHVDAGNTGGIHIYEQKFGFEILEELDNEYGRGGTQVKMRRMLTGPLGPSSC